MHRPGRPLTGAVSVNAVIATLAIAGSVGCGDRRPFEERVRGYGELRQALATSDTELRSLLGAVRAQRGLPTDLARREPDDSANAAVALDRLMDDSLRWALAASVARLVEAETTATPDGRSAPKHARRVASLLASQNKLREGLAEAADRPRCAFPIDPAIGYFAKLRHLDDVAIATRLALLEVADAARREQPQEAYQSLCRALRWCHWLAREPHVEPRVLAATLRDESLRVAGLLLESGVAGSAEGEGIYSLLRDQLNDWPPVRRVLVGDRAVTLQAYEALRDGQLERLLTIDERARLERAGKLGPLASATPADFDRDEANYLRGMALVIDATDRPFYESIGTLDQARREAARAPDLCAARIFLGDVADALRIASRDRARCEGWAIALASAGDFTMPPYRTNPTTGIDYRVERDAEWVRVDLGDATLDDPACPVLSPRTRVRAAPDDAAPAREQ
jgi:hypothetical protein